MPEVADLYVRLRAVTGEFQAQMMAAGAEGEKFGAKMAAAKAGSVAFGAALAVGIGAAAVAAVKLGSEFQRSMEQIHTMAHVPQADIGKLSQGVLGLAGQVGFAPNSLAQALYHIESNFASVGLSGKKALDALKVAAEGAQVGHADLVDVTNALGAAIASGIPGVQNYGSAMGSMLSIVGSGDMTMQNLADSFSTGILAIGKQFGVTLSDMGAALATLGDNNIRGQHAATLLRMAIMDLTKQAKPGITALQSIGIASGQLGRDMQTGGMNKAIIDLRNHLNAAGITGVKVGQFLETAFTKRSSAPLAVLMGQFDRFESKFPEIAKGANTFGSAWSAAAAGLSIQWDKFKSGIEASLTSIGLKLLPIVTKALGKVNDAFAWLGKHQDVVRAIAVGIGMLLVPALLAVADAIGPFLLLEAALFAVGAGLVYAYEHSATFRDIVNAAGKALKTGLGASLNWMIHSLFPALTAAWQATWNTIKTVAEWFINGPLKWVQDQFNAFAGWWHTHGEQIIAIAQWAWGLISTYIKVEWDVIKETLQVGLAWLSGIWKFTWDLVLNVVKLAWNLIKDWVTIGIHLVVNTISVALDLLTGHWGQAWTDMKNLVGQAFSDIEKLFADFASGALTLLYQAGKDVVTGLINGIKGSLGAVGSAVKNIGKAALSGIKNALGIKSPSLEFHKVGLSIGEGLVNGINASAASVNGAVGRLVAVPSTHRTAASAAHHKVIDAEQKILSQILAAETHRRAQISTYATAHKTKAGEHEAMAMWNQFHARLERTLKAALADRKKILHDPAATAGEKKRAVSQVDQVRRQLAEANKLHTRLLDIQTKALKVATTAATHHNLKISARQAVMEDLPTYLAAASHAGWTGSAGFTAPQHSSVSVPIEITLDGQVVHKSVQRRVLRHETRNRNNGLSRYPTSNRR